MKTERTIRVILSAIMGFALLLGQSCKKEHVALLPTISTSSITSITTEAALGGGAVTSDGGASVTGRGVCWSVNASPTTSDSKTQDGNGLGTFTSSLTGLTPGTTYFVRAYAINSEGTAYGSAQTFTTESLPLPELTTAAISDITLNSATGGGAITSTGGLAVTARGICWGTTTTPTISDSKTNDGTVTGSFVSSLTGLSQGTVYNVRAYATTAAGTGYGSVVSFTTKKLPGITTAAINVAVTTATGGGNVTGQGSSSIVASGVCWSLNPTPTILDNITTDGTALGSFVSNLTGLSANTTYYVRAYATNASGTAYGDQITFLTYGVMDVEGNGYPTVVIGAQEWMQVNLRTTKYNDGTDIPNVTDATTWGGLSTGAYCEYNNNNAIVATYGRLYNYYAVADAHQLCPTDWHAPTDSEWDDMTNFLGGATTAGGKLKVVGTNLWGAPNSGATNQSKFSALPAGSRGDTMGGPPWIYTDQTGTAHFWTSTSVNPTYAYWRAISYNSAELFKYTNFSVNGKSVRCLKD